MIASAVLETARAQPDLPALMALSAFAAPATATPKLAMIGVMEQQLREGIKTGALRPAVDAKLVAHMAHGMVESAMREIIANPTRAPQEIVQHSADAYARWLLAS